MPRIVRVLIFSLMGWNAVGEIPQSVWAAADFHGEENNQRSIQQVTVHIENRRFMPHLVHLHVGQPTRLILMNDDAELHAFVPTDLLAKTNVQVGGNGSPEFDRSGFRRVLLPSSGQAELTFSPKKVGSYPFFCDLPGHIMNGTVMVED